MSADFRSQYDVRAARERLARDVERGRRRDWRTTLRYASTVPANIAAAIAADVERRPAHWHELPRFLRDRARP